MNKLISSLRLTARNLLFLIVITLTTTLSVKASDISIEYKSDKLSADVSNAPMQNVLTLLSVKLDIPIFLDQTLKAKKVSAKFENMTVEDGIKKIVHPYSTAIIFGKKTNAEGKNVFFISKLNVYNSSNKEPAYLAVGDTKNKKNHNKGNIPISERTHRAQKKTEIPEERKDPAKAARLNKKISASILRSKITYKTASIRKLQQKMADQKKKKMMQIQNLEQQLSSADDQEKKELQSKLILLRSDMNSSREKDAQALKKHQIELERMKKKIKNYEQAEVEKKK